MLIKAAGLGVGLAAIFAAEIPLAGVHHHVLFQPGSIREALVANVTRQWRGKASGSLEKQKQNKSNNRERRPEISK